LAKHIGPKPARPKRNIALLELPVFSEGQSRWAEATMESHFDFHATSQGPEPILLNSSDPLSPRLIGRRISQISAIGYPTAGSIYPYKQQKIRWQEMAQIFDKIIDPCSLAGV
jgi:hypothetical protein